MNEAERLKEHKEAEFLASVDRHDSDLPKILRAYARTHISDGHTLVASNLLRAAKLLEEGK